MLGAGVRRNAQVRAITVTRIPVVIVLEGRDRLQLSDRQLPGERAAGALIVSRARHGVIGDGAPRPAYEIGARQERICRHGIGPRRVVVCDVFKRTGVVRPGDAEIEGQV